MKIQITANKHTHTWESEADDVDLEELTHQLKGLLVGAGYHPKIVDECFSEDAWSWFPEEKQGELQDN